MVNASALHSLVFCHLLTPVLEPKHTKKELIPTEKYLQDQLWKVSVTCSSKFKPRPSELTTRLTTTEVATVTWRTLSELWEPQSKREGTGHGDIGRWCARMNCGPPQGIVTIARAPEATCLLG